MQLGSKFDNYIAQRSFRYLRARSLARYAQQVDRNLRPIVVLQMGKVGSSSVVKTLQQTLPDHFVHHVHFLSQPWVNKIEGLFETAGKVKKRHQLHRHVSAARYLMDNLDRDAGGKPKLIVSLMRDPIARNVSSFFQAFPQYYPEIDLSSNDSGKLDALPTEKLIRLFLEDFGEDRHQMPLIWFNEHIRKNFDLNIYDQPFDSERGYTVIENASCRLLLMTMEQMPGCLSAGLQAFVGKEPEIPENENVSSQKKYGAAYKRFLADIRFPKDYLDRMYSSEVVNYFYSADQIAQFRQRWSSSPD